MQIIYWFAFYVILLKNLSRLLNCICTDKINVWPKKRSLFKYSTNVELVGYIFYCNIIILWHPLTIKYPHEINYAVNNAYIISKLHHRNAIFTRINAKFTSNKCVKIRRKGVSVYYVKTRKLHLISTRKLRI